MTNREYLNTLSTREFIERIVSRFWKIAEENKMDYVHYNQQNCYNDLIEWLDEEYDEQKEIKERKAKFEKQIEQIKESGIPIKKYKAKVRNFMSMTTLPDKVNTDAYKIVKGYVSIQSIVLPYGLNETPQYHYVFVSEEIDFSQIAMSGFGKSVYTPIMYDEFEII